MVDVWRAVFPGVDFRHGDARDLSQFDDNSFAMVVSLLRRYLHGRSSEQNRNIGRRVPGVEIRWGIFMFYHEPAVALS